MKTQTFKRNVIHNLMVSILVILLLWLTGILFLSGFEEKHNSKPSELNVSNKMPDIHLLKSIKPINIFDNTNFNQNLEMARLNTKISEVTERIELGILSEKLNEFAKPEQEPKLELGIVLSLKFPEIEDESFSNRENRTYVKNKFLEEMGRQKYYEVLEFYALEKWVKESYVLEKETPLKTEHWMLDEKCWCTESNNNLASNKE